MRGATKLMDYKKEIWNISTHTPHARCDLLPLFTITISKISTHTPHARCDNKSSFLIELLGYFYSHTSCEVRLKIDGFVVWLHIFLLTHLMRGATLDVVYLFPELKQISTHTPHARCDNWKLTTRRTWNRFLLTHLMRGATPWKKN